jgi:hypothetical protein
MQRSHVAKPDTQAGDLLERMNKKGARTAGWIENPDAPTDV